MITAVVAAYDAERWIAETLEAILAQTRPPDEVVVVDDGSTDGTPQELERFADRIKIVRQPNRGCPAAFNRAFREARGDFVAMCGADDVWERRKLEWQLEAIQAHPEVDVFLGHAVLFGRLQGQHGRPPGSGLLDSSEFRRALFRDNCVCAPSVVIRRSVFERLGPFVEDFGADDYEYWMRCLRAGVRFYYDPRPLLAWRQHERNLSAQKLWMAQCTYEVRTWYEGDVGDSALRHEVFADVLFRIGRMLVDEGRPREARTAFLKSLRHGRGASAWDNLRAAGWAAVLSLPAGARERTGEALIGVRRALENLRRGRRPALP